MRNEPNAQQIRDEHLYTQLGLNKAEYERVCKRLGRLPNYVETGLFGVLWSEHCSYKSSKKYLRNFPTTGPQVLQGPGENAGVVDVGEGVGVAFKMESHNHPSAIEPYQGAATGVGGILRDVFTMGARPIAFLNSLRFGSLEDAHTRYLFKNVVAGIGGYGNCVGIPTVGGEVVFDDIYKHNPLVNAMCVGVLPAEKIMKGEAKGVGNPVFVVGSRTGRDGIHGATFASAEDPHAKERSAVQVGDPFLGKLLMEASLELIETGAVVGIQDMGAAGLTSSSAEMASRAGGGLEMHLDKVPVREEGMSPYEMMLSESQERMLVVMEKGKEQLAFDILRKWGLEIGEIGRVTDDGMLRLVFQGEVVANVPVEALVDEAPVYDRPVAEEYPQKPLVLPEQLPDHTQALKDLLSHPTVASKHWVYRQYDTSVRASTYVQPGGDAAVVLVPGTSRAVALTTDGNGRYVKLNPKQGGAIVVAEAARNIAVTGGKPLALTNCLNFGNPEKPEVMFQFKAVAEGMSEASLALDTPVVSGNVSFYNESHGQDIDPTPVIGMVGVVEDMSHVRGNAFQQAESAVYLLGNHGADVNGSLYAHLVSNETAGDAPYFNLEEETALLKLLLAVRGTEGILSAHDISDGGLAAALAEMTFKNGIGVHVETSPLGSVSDEIGYLFSEAQGRVVVELTAEGEAILLEKSAEFNVPMQKLGTTGGETVVIKCGDKLLVEAPVALLGELHGTSITQTMQEPLVQTAG